MYTENSDVLSGQANGSRVRFCKLYLKAGEQSFPLKLKCGTTINAVYASQVYSIKLKHENAKMMPQIFEVKVRDSTFNCRMKIGSEVVVQAMKGSQLPLVSNTATTGHKLQGCTLMWLFVYSWRYGSNWAYVVLSRVRLLQGLYLKEPLSLDLQKYKMNEKMQAMITWFKETKTLPIISEEDYSELEIFDEGLELQVFGGGREEHE
jgi:hypothetical protein